MLPGFTGELSISGPRHTYQMSDHLGSSGSGGEIMPQSFDLNACIAACYSPDKECVNGCFTLEAISMATDMVLGPAFPF